MRRRGVSRSVRCAASYAAICSAAAARRRWSSERTAASTAGARSAARGGSARRSPATTGGRCRIEGSAVRPNRPRPATERRRAAECRARRRRRRLTALGLRDASRPFGGCLLTPRPVVACRPVAVAPPSVGRPAPAGGRYRLGRAFHRPSSRRLLGDGLRSGDRPAAAGLSGPSSGRSTAAGAASAGTGAGARASAARARPSLRAVSAATSSAVARPTRPRARSSSVRSARPGLTVGHAGATRSSAMACSSDAVAPLLPTSSRTAFSAFFLRRLGQPVGQLQVGPPCVGHRVRSLPSPTSMCRYQLPGRLSAGASTAPTDPAATWVGRIGGRHGQVRAGAHAGQDQQAVHARAARPGDVGVEPVAHDQRPVRPALARRPSGTGPARACPTTTSGSRPSAVATAATRIRCPATAPRGLGSVRSVLVATHNAPARTASVASARCGPAHLRAVPLHHRDRLVVARSRPRCRPASATSSRSASAPTTRTGAPGSNRSASSRGGRARGGRRPPRPRRGTPMPSSRSATSPARRDALLVANITGTPGARSCSDRSAARGWAGR